VKSGVIEDNRKHAVNLKRSKEYIGRVPVNPKKAQSGAWGLFCQQQHPDPQNMKFYVLVYLSSRKTVI
jgi:hypothetical protein